MPRVSTLKPATVVCPYRVAVDTREQRPYLFQSLLSNADQGSKPLVVSIERHTLTTGQGDYSIVELLKSGPFIGIERKSKADLYQSISQARDNFEKRLGLMTEGLALGGAHVVVEADPHELLTSPPRHTRMLPKSLWRTILAWQIRYPLVHWHFMWSRDAAEAQTFRLLERFWNVHGDEIQDQSSIQPRGFQS